MPERIGLFGGTFDPPHLGHLILAAELRYQLGLDRLLWVLTPHSPLKEPETISQLDHRLAMVRLALRDDPDLELSTVELDRPGPHYTLDTVQTLASQFPGADLVLAVGGDSLRDLPKWHRLDELVAACCQIGVMRRPGDAVNLDALERVVPGISEKVQFVDAPLLEIASSEIRRRVGEGKPFRYYLPPAVYEYIQKNYLYR
jgi:nicotinate-nucleotide adenylyltransferase